MKIEITKNHLDKISTYPERVREKLSTVRSLILTVAEEIGIDKIEETLKWNEPSFLVKKGSTIRYDWKVDYPDQIQIYFKCTSKIVPSIKAAYGELFDYQANRAICLKLKDDIPIKETKTCIRLALKYYSLKQLDHLGII